MTTTAEALAVVREALLQHTEGYFDQQEDALAALALIEERVEELEVRDKMRDDGERHLLSELEARDAHIRELEAALREVIEHVEETFPAGTHVDPVFALARRALGGGE